MQSVNVHSACASVSMDFMVLYKCCYYYYYYYYYYKSEILQTHLLSVVVDDVCHYHSSCKHQEIHKEGRGWSVFSRLYRYPSPVTYIHRQFILSNMLKNYSNSIPAIHITFTFIHIYISSQISIFNNAPNRRSKIFATCRTDAQLSGTNILPTAVHSCLDPSAAPPSVFRLARTKSGWRADPHRPKFGWRRRQTFLAAAAVAEIGASS